MTDRRDRRAPRENSALYYNTLLRAENLSMRARRRPGSIDREAAAYAAERRYAWETRRRPGYASIEARRPFEADARLIRRDPDATKAKAIAKPPRKPTYEEMRAQRDEYPDKPEEVRQYQKRKKEQKRARRSQQKSGRGGRKN